MIALVLTIAAGAQTLNVHVGGVIYQFPASQTGEMNYADGEIVTIMGKTFTLADVGSMTVDNNEVTDNLIRVEYGSSSATVYVAGNVARYVDVSLSGAHVTIAQTNTEAIDGDEITYQLSGATTDGSFNLDGSYKCTISLAGLTMTNPGGAAINITNKKRIQLSAKNGTENTLADGSNGSQKACIYSKGQLQLQGKGTLNVAGNTKHAIKSGDYISVKNLTLNITKAVGDGINSEEYFLMKSGTVSISGVGDDGIQCDLGGETSTGETSDHEDEDSGNIYLEGGTLNVVVTADAAKGIKAEGDLRISDGDITVKTTGGGTWDSDESKTKASSCLSADGNITISGGSMNLTSTGAGGKGINGDGTFTATGGTITIKTSGNAVVASSNGNISTVSNSQQLDRYQSNYKSSPKGIKIDGAILVGDNAVIDVTTSGAGGEGIESKSTLTVEGGTVYAFSASDDAINSASHMYLKGGTVTGVSNGNDGIDSNGNMYISGGTVIACGSGDPECGLDAAEHYYLYITGGTVLGIGGGNNTVTATTDSQCVLSTSSSTYSAGTAVTIKSGTTELASFTIPSDYSPTSGGGGGGPGGGPGGGGWPGGGGQGGHGFNFLLSCSGLTSGNNYTVTIGSSSASCRAATSYSGR